MTAPKNLSTLEECGSQQSELCKHLSGAELRTKWREEHLRQQHLRAKQLDQKQVRLQTQKQERAKRRQERKEARAAVVKKDVIQQQAVKVPLAINLLQRSHDQTEFALTSGLSIGTYRKLGWTRQRDGDRLS